MGTNHLSSFYGRATAAATGLSALVFTYGCGGVQGPGVSAQTLAANQTVAPVVVSCEPNQRTIVRPTVVNGAAMSQVECVTTGQPLGSPAVAAAQPAPQIYRERLVQAARTPALEDARVIDDARVVPAVQDPVTTARPVRAQQVVYGDDRPVRVAKRERTVQKSAIIIGSSAGVGAGVGAAVGGKKGALLGAVIGGGGATLWDQITRRK